DWSSDVCSSDLVRVLKHNAGLMGIELIFVDQHQCPLTIWPKQGICRYQDMSGGVGNVAGCWEHFVNGGPRLRPFLRDQLTREVLRGVLLNMEVGIGGEHAER